MNRSEPRAQAFILGRTGILILLILVLLTAAVASPVLDITLYRDTILLCTLCAALWWFRKRRLPHPLAGLYALLYVLASLTLTSQAIASGGAQPLPPSIHALPDLALLYRITHYALIIWLILGELLPPAFHLPAVWPALFLYSSYLYFRAFQSAELGVLYPTLFALFLGYVLVRPQLLYRPFRHSLATSRIVYALLAFMLLAGLAALLSPAPGESLEHYLPVVFYGILPFFLAGETIERRRWQYAAAWTVLLGGVLFAVLAAVKFGLVLYNLGLEPALRYRLFISNVGPNWVSRPLVILLPLGACLSLYALIRWRRWLWAACSVSMVLAAIYTQSNSGLSGWLALALGGGSLLLLLLEPALRSAWADHRLRGVSISPSLLIALVVTALLAVVLMGGLLSQEMNPFSFSGRLYIWRTALLQIADHPFLGSGLGVRYPASLYGGRLLWEDMGPRAQFFLDAPLSQVWQKRQVTVHAHSLALELAVGAGLPALLAFLWYIWEVAQYSLSTLRRASGRSRVLIAGATAGLVAALAWGLLDVLEFSPPFLSFPAWALIGLVLAAPQALAVEEDPAARDRRWPARVWPSPPMSQVSRFIYVAGCLAAVVITVLMPLIGNLHYRRAYTALHQRRWQVAAVELDRAALWQPLNAKAHELRGEALINLGRYDDAISAYGRALRLRRGFAPYHAQLGWLYWLKGELDQATTHFQRAVELDPREAWRTGLHADLGLAYAAQGRMKEAIALFKASTELDPGMARAAYWVPILETDGTYNLVLDPVYKNGPSPELDKRILTHLGRADYTPRLFAPPQLPLSPLLPSLTQVLSALEVDYLAARATGSREAPRLLATLAEAARLAGLQDRAELAYLEFQQTYPESAYGFRDLGRLYREQGRLSQAQAELERAVAVSPRDTASRYELAEVYLDHSMWQDAEAVLDTITRLAPLDSRLYALRVRLHQDQGELAAATVALNKSLFIEGTLPQRLALAQLYGEQGLDTQARAQCLKAASVLLDTSPPPLAPELWQVAVCVAQNDGSNAAGRLIALARRDPLAGNVLLGHTHRVQGQLARALSAYQRASIARPDEGGPHYFLGKTYQALGQPEQAEAAYRQAAQLDVLESLPLLALGQMQWSLGRQEAAVESYRTAVKETPGWGAVRLALGNALLAQGNRAGAALLYQQGQFATNDLQEGLVYDFAAHLADAEIRSPGAEYVRHDYFSLDGEERRVLFMHPNATVLYPVWIPEGAQLAFDVATAPESWAQPGDGVTFAIYIEPVQPPAPGSLSSTSSLPAPGSSAQQLFTTYIDPKHDAAARRWIPYTLDLSAYAGEQVVLVFDTTAGPAGDDRYDWAGWGMPRLLKP